MHYTRKVQLTNICKQIFNQVPREVKGNQSLAQLTLTRIMAITQKRDEVKYMVDVITVMIKKAGDPNARIEIADDKNIRK